MRIQEMRSGAMHLKKKMQPEAENNYFEYSGAHDVVLPEPEAQPGETVECELDEPRWSVVSFSQVEAGGLTFFQASRLMAELDATGMPGLCLTTDDAARKALIGS